MSIARRFVRRGGVGPRGLGAGDWSSGAAAPQAKQHEHVRLDKLPVGEGCAHHVASPPPAPGFSLAARPGPALGAPSIRPKSVRRPWPLPAQACDRRVCLAYLR